MSQQFPFPHGGVHPSWATPAPASTPTTTPTTDFISDSSNYHNNYTNNNQTNRANFYSPINTSYPPPSSHQQHNYQDFSAALPSHNVGAGVGKDNPWYSGVAQPVTHPVTAAPAPSLQQSGSNSNSNNNSNNYGGSLAFPSSSPPYAAKPSRGLEGHSSSGSVGGSGDSSGGSGSGSGSGNYSGPSLTTYAPYALSAPLSFDIKPVSSSLDYRFNNNANNNANNDFYPPPHHTSPAMQQIHANIHISQNLQLQNTIAQLQQHSERLQREIASLKEGYGIVEKERTEACEKAAELQKTMDKIDALYDKDVREFKLKLDEKYKEKQNKIDELLKENAELKVTAYRWESEFKALSMHMRGEQAGGNRLGMQSRLPSSSVLRATPSLKNISSSSNSNSNKVRTASPFLAGPTLTCPGCHEQIPEDEYMEHLHRCVNLVEDAETTKPPIATTAATTASPAKPPVQQARVDEVVLTYKVADSPPSQISVPRLSTIADVMTHIAVREGKTVGRVMAGKVLKPTERLQDLNIAANYTLAVQLQKD